MTQGTQEPKKADTGETPLQPQKFFQGIWTGEGEVVPSLLLKWFVPRQRFYFSCQTHWLTETIWLVKEQYKFSDGRVMERKMFCELVEPRRIHVTADDMPSRARIVLIAEDESLS